MKSSLALCRTKLQVFTLSLILARKQEETVEIYYFDDSYKSDTLDFLNRICKSKGYQFKYFVKKKIHFRICLSFIESFEIKNTVIYTLLVYVMGIYH